MGIAEYRVTRHESNPLLRPRRDPEERRIQVREMRARDDGPAHTVQTAQIPKADRRIAKRDLEDERDDRIADMGRPMRDRARPAFGCIALSRSDIGQRKGEGHIPHVLA